MRKLAAVYQLLRQGYHSKTVLFQLFLQLRAKGSFIQLAGAAEGARHAACPLSCHVAGARLLRQADPGTEGGAAEDAHGAAAAVPGAVSHRSGRAGGFHKHVGVQSILCIATSVCCHQLQSLYSPFCRRFISAFHICLGLCCIPLPIHGRHNSLLHNHIYGAAHKSYLYPQVFKQAADLRLYHGGIIKACVLMTGKVHFFMDA